MKEKLIDNALGAETGLTELKGRLTQLQNASLGTFSYGYDNPLLGQRTSMTSGLGGTNYSYDSNYQLTGATYPNAAPFNGEVHSWTYDNIGNRLTNTVNSSTANYTYFKNGSNPLNGQRLQNDGTKTYTYDANGNVTGDGTYTYTWDYENQLTGISGGGLTTSYSYDHLGRRKSKTVNGVTTTYLYDGANPIRETSSTTGDYVFGPIIDEPLAVSRAGAVSYYSVDGLGSIASLSDSAGALQNAYNYDAWGFLRNQTGSVENPFLYTGRESGEAGLYFYRARFYNPTNGRFISEDPLHGASPETIQQTGSNAFVYVKNEPTDTTDPSGMLPCNYAQLKLCQSTCQRQKRRFVSCTAYRVDVPCLGYYEFIKCSCEDWRKDCPPCPDVPPPVIHSPEDKGAHTHFPCKGGHWHYFEYHQGPPPECICRLTKKLGGCL